MLRNARTASACDNVGSIVLDKMTSFRNDTRSIRYPKSCSSHQAAARTSYQPFSFLEQMS